MDIFLGWFSGLLLGLWLTPIVKAEAPDYDRAACLGSAVLYAAAAAVWWASTLP